MLTGRGKRARAHSAIIPLAVVAIASAFAGTEPGAHDAPSRNAALAARPAATPGVLSVMNAASITRPVRAALDSFAARTGATYALEPGASLEVARRMTELHRTPDVVLLADPDVFPQLLMPQYVHWYALFARNRIVLAYTARSRGADRINTGNWRTIITEPGVEVGRANPNTDPSGYRTLLTMQLAEQHYGERGLFARLLAAAPERNVRPREADQVALLQTHELDYIWTYQNLAENDGLKYVKLPDEIDLGNPADGTAYARAETRVLGKRPGDTLTMRGAPILFALSIPEHAENQALAEKFVAYLLSPDGRRVLRAQHLDALDEPVVVGSGGPRPNAPRARTSPGRARPPPR
jgi:molybdate/tungstate transport system substrate-binding protein